MPSPRGFSLLLTASQAASRLGLPIQTVLGWAAAGKLRIAGQDVDGRALFREGVVDSCKEELAALALPELGRRLRKKPHDEQVCTERGRPLSCGCNLERSPLHLCRTGAALIAAFQLTEMIAAAMPDDPFLRKLAGHCREAVMKHLMPGGGPTTVPSPRRDLSDHSAGENQVAVAGETCGSGVEA
jgi:hypothetical protein